MEQTPMPFMRSPQAPASRAEFGREQPTKKPPQEPSLHREKWDKREHLTHFAILKLRQLQDRLEREQDAMASVDPKEAEETFGEDLALLKTLSIQLKEDPDNKDPRMMLDEIWERRMPKIRKSA